MAAVDPPRLNPPIAYATRDRLRGKSVTLVLNAPSSTFEGSRWDIARQMVAFARRKRALVHGKTIWAARYAGVSLAAQLDECVQTLTRDGQTALPDAFRFVYPLDQKVYLADISMGFVHQDAVLDVDTAIATIQAGLNEGHPVFGQPGGVQTQALETAGCLVRQAGLTVDPFSAAAQFRPLLYTLLRQGYLHWHMGVWAAALCLVMALPVMAWHHLEQQAQAALAASRAKLDALQREQALQLEPLVAAQLPAVVETLAHTAVWVANGLEGIVVHDNTLTLTGHVTSSAALDRVVQLAAVHALPLALSEKGWRVGPLPLRFPAPAAVEPPAINGVLAAVVAVGERHGMITDIEAVVSDNHHRQKATLTFRGPYRAAFFDALGSVLAAVPSQIDSSRIVTGGEPTQPTAFTVRHFTISLWGMPNDPA